MFCFIRMRGILSEGMVMCASTPEKVEIIDPPAGAVPGDRIVCPGYEGICSVDVNHIYCYTYFPCSYISNVIVL